MHKLILQMQVSVDGYVSAAAPGTNWQVWNWSDDWTWDAALRREFNATLARAGGVLLSRPMIEEGYLDHWTGVASRHPDDDDFAFARRIVAVPKIVVTNKLDRPHWPATRIAHGDLIDAVNAAKASSEGDLVTFGGTGFARALLRNGLVDELQLYVNPAAIGAGSKLFDDAGLMRFTPLEATVYECGIVVVKYRPLSA